MITTITRPGQVTELKLESKTEPNQKRRTVCVVSYSGGYAKFYYNENEVPDGLQLKDKVEVSFTIQEPEED